MRTIEKAASKYYTDGLIPIRTKEGSKAPVGKNWQNTWYPDGLLGVEVTFRGHAGGVGLLLGMNPVGYLLDVDLDSEEAKELAGLILPEASMNFGREGKLTHYLYLINNEIPTIRFTDVDGSVFLEMRGTGSQTLVPPSAHPSGERLEWNKYEIADPVYSVDLEEKIRVLAAITLLRRHWPSEGSRQNLTLALTGFLLHSRFSPEFVAEFMDNLLVGIAQYTAERLLAVKGTIKAFERRENVTGGPTVKDILGEKVYDKLVSFLNIKPVEYTFDDLEESETRGLGTTSLISIYDLVSKDVYNQSEVVEGLIWAGKTHWLYSDPNAGKTMLALAIALHIAAGKNFSGRYVKQGPVVIVEEDSSLAVIAGYLDNFASVYDTDFRDLPVYFNEEQGIRIFRPRDVDRIFDLVDSCSVQPSLVIFDSCERILPSNTFNSREVDPLDRLLKDLANRGIANLVLDHTNKSQYENPNDMDVLYGSRAKSAIADIMLQLSGSIKLGALNGVFTKFRGDTPPPINIYYRADDGFDIKDAPGGTKTPYEGEVYGWFLARLGTPTWHTKADILRSLCPDGELQAIRRLERTLNSLSSRRILRRAEINGEIKYKRNMG